MSKKSNDSNDEALISFWTVRKAVGTVGILLPILLVVGKLVVHAVCPACGEFRGQYDESFIQPSISSYYWTVVGDILVGSLAAIGVFMFSYTGPHRADNVPGNIACFSALGVALFPTTPETTHGMTVVGTMHYLSAAILFGTLAYFCLRVFQRPDIGGSDDLKPVRNRVYQTCGIVIIVCIVAILMVKALSYFGWMAAGFWIFIFEAVAIWAFGWSWFVKGKGFNLLRK